MKEKVMRRQMFVVITLVLVCIAALPVTVLANEQAWQTSIQIPVIVNIYNNSINGTQLNNSINESNKLLKQADIKLVVIKTNDPPGVGNGDDGDGNFTKAERKEILEFGGKELNSTPNQKGIKLSFGQYPEAEDSSTVGLAHPPEWGANWTEGKPGNPTIMLRYTNDTDTGNTIAHELGHVSGIKGDYDNASRIMDYAGRGSTFNESEIKQMKMYKYKFGKCTVQWKEAFSAVKEETQFGTITDDADDQGNPVSAIYDLHQVYMTSAVGLVNISGEITVADPLPTGEEIDAVYSLGFDVDDNSGTGVTYAGYNGIDRIVWINITENISSGTFVVTGELENPTMGTTESLPEVPIVATQIEIADFNGGTQPWATTLFFEIPKGMLGMSVSEVPVVATAGNSTSIHDTASFIFDSQRWLKDPTFTTFGTGVPTPGGNYPFEISGLEPNDPFDLYLDDTKIMSDTLDGSGSFSGNFVFPANLSNSEMHFLTAQDSTGEFAYSITCPKAIDLTNLGSGYQEILPGGTSTFIIRVSNFGLEPDTINLDSSIVSQSSSCKWTVALSKNIVTLGPNSHEDITLSVTSNPDCEISSRIKVKVTGISQKGLDVGETITDSVIKETHVVPEFPTIAIPMLSAIGILFVLRRMK